MIVSHASQRARPVFGLLLALAAVILAPAPGAAQLFFSRLPPGQIVTIVRSQGYRNPSNPFFRGDIYVVDAFDPRGQNVRLVINPSSGEIVERLLIRNQRVIPAPDSQPLFVQPRQRYLNPSDEAAQTERRAGKARRIARRPVERAPVFEPGARVRPPDPAPAEANAPAQSNAPATAPAAPPRAAIAPPAEPAPPRAIETRPVQQGEAAQGAPPGPGDRGTRTSPRRVGPVILPPAIGVE